MRTLILFLIALCVVFVDHVSADPIPDADSLTITTYYPAPYGEYQQIRLTPTDDLAPGTACTNAGTLYFDDSDQRLYVCSNGRWQGFVMGDITCFGPVCISLLEGANATTTFSSTFKPMIGDEHVFSIVGFAKKENGKIYAKVDITDVSDGKTVTQTSGWVEGLIAQKTLEINLFRIEAKATASAEGVIVSGEYGTMMKEETINASTGPWQ